MTARSGASRGGARPRAGSVVAAGIVAIAAACGAEPGDGPGVGAGGPGAGPASEVDEGALLRDLEATVLENYGLLELGNIEAYADRAAADRPIAIFGARADAAVAGVAPPELYDDRRLFAGRRVRMLSRNLDLHLSPEGHVSWTFDDVSYRVSRDGREASIPLRVTGLYTRDVDRWALALEHRSYPRPVREIIARARSGDLPQPARFRTSYDIDGPATQLRRVVPRVIFDAIGPHYRDSRLADTADALVVLPGVAREYSGADVAEAPTLAELFAGPDGEGAAVELGDHLIRVAASRDVAWMAANIAVRPPADESTIGLRGTFVFEDRPRAGWVLVQTHVSAPVAGARVAERVFGSARLD